MKKKSCNEWAEILDALSKELDSKCSYEEYGIKKTMQFLVYEGRDKVSVGAYISKKEKKFCIPMYKKWGRKIMGVNKFKFYINIEGHFSPVKDELIIEKQDLTDFYIIISRTDKETKRNFLELFNNNNMLFSIQISDFWFKCGMDLKIIYTTEMEGIYTKWVYREGKHIAMCSSKDRWFSESEYFTKNRKSINIFNGDYVELFFHYENCKRFYVAEYFARTNGDYFSLLPKQFKDDDTCNYIVGFKKDRYEDILFMNYCVQSEIGGYAVYGLEVKELSKGCVREKGEEAFYEELKSIWETIDYELQCREILKHIYKVANIKEDLSHVPKLRYFDRTQAQSTSVVEYTQEHYRILERDDYPKFKGRYDTIYDELVEKGVVEVKWKSEYELYKMVKRKYPDAIYQYRKNWLGMQSLDVYIPSLKIAIEYQGEQHYRAISLFGGEEGFKYRKVLDEKKRKLCKENDVWLIEWKYDEKISTVLLNKKLKGVLG